MKNYSIYLLLCLSFTTLSAQVGIGTTDPKATLDIYGAPTSTTITDGFIPPRMSRSQLINKIGYGADQTGTIIYITDLSGTNNTQTKNITEVGYYYFNGLIWAQLHDSIKTTYETIPLSVANQTISVRDADKIVGFSLISTSNFLSTTVGKMSGTWMLGSNRDKIICFIQTLEHPFIKFITVSVEINNATNEINFTGYSSRYWTYTNSTPQNNLSNNQNTYELGKIVVIRKE